MARNITNTESNTLISGTSGNDTIFNTGARVTIAGGKGNDLIYDSGWTSSINGGAGKDSIYSSLFSTIIGGKGDDLISVPAVNFFINHNKVIKYKAGEGNDTILGFG